MPDKIIDLCKGKISSFNTVVVGDFMLDRYIYGKADRISPEAPVPVIKFSHEKIVAGGAGNVVANLKALGMRVTGVGRIGDDLYGEKLMDALQLDNTSLFFRRGSTILKTRILGDRGQQMLRLDTEEIMTPYQEEELSVITYLKEATAAGSSCIIISDYGKGFCSDSLCRRIIEFGCENNIPVFVDPKKQDWTAYSGAFAVTPNMKELEKTAGCEVENSDASVSTHGSEIRDKYKIQNLIVTRSQKGSTLITDSAPVHIRSGAVDVYDVSGAGDTVIAYTAAFYTAGIGLEDSIRTATTAAQVAIGKVGTYPVSASDMLAALTAKNHNNKILSAEDAQKLCSDLKNKGKRVIFTNGCFDILHSGHIDSLTKARELGDFLIVGLNSDDSIRRLKGETRPVNKLPERAKLLAAMGVVDAVVAFEEDTPYNLLSLLRPDVIVKGGDYKPEDVAGREFADEVVIIPLTEGFSTTNIIKSMEKISDK